MPLLELRNVESHYGNVRALKGVSLHVEAGEIVTLLGANGA
jgi:branched-chain amino acid transport system ATP-binding protein